MKIYRKHSLKIFVILLIIFGIIIVSLNTKINSIENEKQGTMWKEHLMRIHSVSYVLEHVATDMQSSPVPVEHIDSKLRIAINSEVTPTTKNFNVGLDDENHDIDLENYDLDYIVWWIYEDLLGIVNNENQLSEDEYKELANTLNTFNDSLEEYWFSVGNENKNEKISDTRSVLIDILNEIQSINTSL